MEKSFSKSYKNAGVDITAGYQAVELMKKHIAKTVSKNALSELGGFGGLFELNIEDIKNPVLVSGTDGVGTKLKLAFDMDKHDTIGIDCVAMCVNDIICCGAKPLFFLDYIACGKNYPKKIENIVKGICDGCIKAGCSLIGGETAEMPDFYPINEYDLAGFSVGVVDKNRILNKKTIKEGDIIIALKSSGVHSNGFSLVRKILKDNKIELNTKFEELNNKSIGETLLEPTKIYVSSVLELNKKINIKSISHITGGGFYENIPRGLIDGMSAKININNIEILPIFNILKEIGKIEQRDMFNTFNMGVGMTLVVDKSDVKTALQTLKECGENAYVLGEIIKSNEGVILT